MKFEDFRRVLIGAVKARQDADMLVSQALLDFDLKESSDEEVERLYALASKADDFSWKGMSQISGEKWGRENEARKAEEARKAAEEVEEAEAAETEPTI